MSCTEIYGFGSDGFVKNYIEIENAWRGAMAVWRYLERKYLPSLPRPLWAGPEDNYFSRTTAIFDEKAMDEIWGLANNSNVLEDEKICLMSTFDTVLIKKENFKKLIRAFQSFGGETSLKEQAEAIKLFDEDSDIIAIGFNQTSISSSKWESCNEETESYNCLTQEEHWWLFEELS